MMRGAKGIRTPDLLIANETLYQLSYSPNVFIFNDLRRFLELIIFPLDTALVYCNVRAYGSRPRTEGVV
jgi:hypothetical protein